jgi:RNA polymerase sigma factor (sigma-70 family)
MGAFVDAPPMEFAELMRQLAAGSREAADQLYRLYGKHVRRVIRHKLAPELRREFDSTDFLQDVWASYFAQPRVFESPADLTAFLFSLARHKITDKYRQRIQTQKYNHNRTRPLDSTTLQRLGEPAARTPPPSHEFAAREQWDRLNRGLPDRERRILDLLRQGYTHAQIGQALGVHEKMVQRLVRRLRPRVAS